MAAKMMQGPSKIPSNSKDTTTAKSTENIKDKKGKGSVATKKSEKADKEETKPTKTKKIMKKFEKKDLDIKADKEVKKKTKTDLEDGKSTKRKQTQGNKRIKMVKDEQEPSSSKDYSKNEPLSDLKEEIPHDFHKKIIEKWQEEDTVYYETRYYQSVLTALKNHSFVMVIGRPGVGKTATIRHIALQMEKEGFNIVPVSEIKDIVQYGSLDHKQVFLIDNVFGIYGMQIENHHKFIDYKEQITNILECESKFLMTCRKLVYNEGLEVMSGLFNSLSVIDLDSQDNQLSNDEKQNILKNHCVKKGVETKRYENIKFGFPPMLFPFLCKLFSNERKFQEKGVNFFKHPITSISQELDKLQVHDAVHYAALICCALNQNKLSEDTLKTPETKQIKINVLSRCGVNSETENQKVLKALSRLEGTYTMQMYNGFTLIHDFIYEVIACHFGKQHPDQILKYMSCDFICNKIKVGENKGNLSIHVPEKHYNALAERLYKDICDMNLYDVFMNVCMLEEGFLMVFMRFLDKKSYKEIKSTFLSVRGGKVASKGGDLCEKKSISKDLQFVDKLKQKSLMNYYGEKGTCGIRVISWVILYGHKTLLQYIFKRIQRSNESVDEVLGSEREEMVRLLFQGCLSGDIDLVKIISNYVAVKEGDGNILCAACITGNIEMVQYLIELLLTNGANVNQCYKYNMSPLYLASQEGHCDVASLLITHGADVSLCDIDSMSPLYIASKEGHCDVASLLITHGADVNMCDKDKASPLHVASQNGHYDVGSLLITQGADVNLCDKNMASPLHKASQKGHCDVASLLITYGADVNLCDEDGASLLYIASQEGHHDMASLLITHGADINLCDEVGASPLFIASEKGHCDVSSFLITHGADINLCDEENMSPLYIASQQGHCEVASLLITHGADVNLCEMDNRSPLYIASHQGHCDVARLLISHGANVNLCNKENVSPLFIASHEGHCDVVCLLITHGANVNLCHTDGRSPLFIASQEGHCDVVSLLITHGADVNLCDRDHLSPLEAATCLGHFDVAVLLIRHGADAKMSDEDST